MRRGGRRLLGAVALCQPWALRRVFCCAGVLIVLQNLMLLYWSSHLLARTGCSGVPAWPPAPTANASSQDPARVPERAAGAEAQPGGDPPPWLQRLRSELEGKSRQVAALEQQLRRASEQRAHTTPPTLGVPEQSAASAPAPGAGRGRQLDRHSSLYAVDKARLRLFGSAVPGTVQMAIGFGSVARKRDYVFETVGTMLGLHGGTSITAEERASVVVVAHLADFNTSWVSHISSKLQAQYPDLVSSGQFHALHAPEELYPPLDICPPFCSYDDESRRVRWRSKQNVDYAFLMYYAAPLAPYYLQIEDDIAFAPNWISKILDFVKTEYPPEFLSKEHAPWRIIDFSQLGFIGKLFQSNELTRMAQFLLLFYDQMPCDILLGNWMRTMTQGKTIDYWKKHASLFQHVGMFRSLGGFQPLEERRFGKLLFDNPPGKIVSNMDIIPTYEPQFAYIPGGDLKARNDVCDYKASPAHAKVKAHRCWFWAKNLAAGQHFTLIFDTTINMRGVFVEFGHAKHPADLLRSGAIEVAARGDGPEACGLFRKLARVEGQPMVYWEQGTSTPADSPVGGVRCVRVVALGRQDEWVAIFQLKVRTNTF